MLHTFSTKNEYFSQFYARFNWNLKMAYNYYFSFFLSLSSAIPIYIVKWKLNSNENINIEQINFFRKSTEQRQRFYFILIMCISSSFKNCKIDCINREVEEIKRKKYTKWFNQCWMFDGAYNPKRKKADFSVTIV